MDYLSLSSVVTCSFKAKWKVENSVNEKQQKWKQKQYSRQWASLVSQTVNNLPAMWETWVRSLGWEDPLEESMANYSSIENPHGQRSLVGYNPKGCKELNMTE